MILGKFSLLFIAQNRKDNSAIWSNWLPCVFLIIVSLCSVCLSVCFILSFFESFLFFALKFQSSCLPICVSFFSFCCFHFLFISYNYLLLLFLNFLPFLHFCLSFFHFPSVSFTSFLSFLLYFIFLFLTATFFPSSFSFEVKNGLDFPRPWTALSKWFYTIFNLSLSF